MNTELIALPEHVMSDADAEKPLVPDQFLVHDDASANWVIRQIVERRAYAERCAEWCKREQTRARHEEDFFLFRYGRQLLEYTRSKIETSGGRRKSVNLPAGTAGFRSEPSKLIIDDENAVLTWAKAHLTKCIVITEGLNKSELNEHVKKTGETPSAGAHLEPAREKFYVK